MNTLSHRSRRAGRYGQLDAYYGHDTGDAVLAEIGLRFPEHASDMCCVIRQGSDEFVVILEGISGQDDVMGFVERFIAALSQPIDVGPEKITITASIGISLFPEHGDNVDTLLHQADIAMIGAKAVPDNSFCFYEKKMSEAQDRVRLTDELEASPEA